jgi:hypothetical protein
MEDKIQQEKGWSIWILILCILLFCGYGVLTAVKQHEQRENFDIMVLTVLQVHNDRLDILDNMQTKNVNQINDLQQFCQQSVLQQQIIQQPQYQQLAGCYGVLPQENVTTFSLQCSREFFVK